MKIFYFTSTGNCLDIAKRFPEAELFSIPKLLKTNNYQFQDQKIGFVFPCYFSGLPRPVKNFIENSVLKSEYFFAVITCGNITASANSLLQKSASKSGFKFDYINEIKMVDNYIPMFDVHKELNAEPGKKIDSSFESIQLDINQSRKMIMYKGMFAKIFTAIMQKVYKGHLDKADYKLSADDNCNSCGICAQVCPAGNIHVETKPVYSHKCEECFACLHNCPQSAIHHKAEKGTLRFRNKNVSLKEIISSNNQLI